MRLGMFRLALRLGRFVCELEEDMPASELITWLTCFKTIEPEPKFED